MALVAHPRRMKQAGYWTRPELLVWGGAPRRNRTGDPILTMNLAATDVRTAVFAPMGSGLVKRRGRAGPLVGLWLIAERMV